MNRARFAAAIDEAIVKATKNQTDDMKFVTTLRDYIMGLIQVQPLERTKLKAMLVRHSSRFWFMFASPLSMNIYVRGHGCQNFSVLQREFIPEGLSAFVDWYATASPK